MKMSKMKAKWKHNENKNKMTEMKKLKKIKQI